MQVTYENVDAGSLTNSIEAFISRSATLFRMKIQFFTDKLENSIGFVLSNCALQLFIQSNWLMMGSIIDSILRKFYNVWTVKRIYLKNDVCQQSFVYSRFNITFYLQIVDRINDRFVRVSGSHKRNEDAAVGGHKDETSETPGASQESNGQEFTISSQRRTSITPCDRFNLLTIVCLDKSFKVRPSTLNDNQSEHEIPGLLNPLGLIINFFQVFSIIIGVR